MRNEDRYLTFALGKGRLANKTLELLEQIGITCEEMKDKELVLSPSAAAELEVMISALEEIIDLSHRVFVDNDLEAAAKVEPLEQVIDSLKEKLRKNHIKRLQQGDCSIEVGFVWSDLLTNMERTSDHCSNIAGCLLEMNRDEMNLHEALKEFRSTNESYQKNLRFYAEKYALN